MDKNQSMIYVIDDDASVRKAVGRLLRSANLNAETYSFAEEFLSSPPRSLKNLRRGCQSHRVLCSCSLL